MKCNYVLEYLNENEYRKKESAIKKYSMLAYKKLIFQIYSSLREGDFQGVIVSRDERYKSESYELPLPTDSMFNKLYGNITLHYTVYLEQMLIMLENITPEENTEVMAKVYPFWLGYRYRNADREGLNPVEQIEEAIKRDRAYFESLPENSKERKFTSKHDIL